MSEALAASAAAFIATNIDDIFILMLLFAQTNDRIEKGRVAAGQYLGMVVLTAVSLLGAFGLGYVPSYYIRYLGLALPGGRRCRRGEGPRRSVHCRSDHRQRR